MAEAHDTRGGEARRCMVGLEKKWMLSYTVDLEEIRCMAIPEPEQK